MVNNTKKIVVEVLEARIPFHVSGQDCSANISIGMSWNILCPKCRDRMGSRRVSFYGEIGTTLPHGI